MRLVPVWGLSNKEQTDTYLFSSQSGTMKKIGNTKMNAKSWKHTYSATNPCILVILAILNLISNVIIIQYYTPNIASPVLACSLIDN